MPEFDNTNRGVLFKNDKKETEKHPNYKGNINIEGVEYWLSGWIKQNDDGSFKLMSLSAQLKEQSGYDSFKAQGQKLKKDEVAEVDHNEPINLDDIPF